MISIAVDKYYGNASYYAVMPVSIFNALERAFLAGQDYAEVNSEEYAQMVTLHAIQFAS